MKGLRVAVWQMEPRRGDIDANLTRLEATMASSEVQGCDLLVAPEMFLAGFSREAVHHAVREDSPLLRRVADVVQSSGIALATSVLVARGAQQFNTFHLWDKRGNLLGRQDKIHLWAEEATRASAGDAARPIQSPWGVVGGMVCYDVEFPEVSRTLALGGAELLLVPSAFYSPTGWDISTRARALENGCYVAAANQIGGDPANPHNGMSRIVDPFGHVVAEVLPDQEGIAVATVDPAVILKAREYAPFLRDRRLGVEPPNALKPRLPS